MMTQHTPHLPHRPAPARHELAYLVLAVLGTVAVVAALVVSRSEAPSPVTEAPAVRLVSAPLGIAAPEGMGVANLPRGYTDYLLP
jgi:hypothetical protein